MVVASLDASNEGLNASKDRSHNDVEGVSIVVAAALSPSEAPIKDPAVRPRKEHGDGEKEERE